MTSNETKAPWVWSGRRVLVTGGQRGLGAAFTEELLTRGAERVYTTSRRPRPSEDPRVVPLELDVTDSQSVRRLAASAGDVSAVFSNAGVTGSPALSVLDSTLDNAAEVFDTNVFGPVRIAQAFAPVLAQHQSSALIHTNSVLSWWGGVGMYGASKAALWSLTNSLRLELASARTRVVSVHLGFADTEMSARVRGVAKVAAPEVAVRVVSGIEQGEVEILVDEVSHETKAKLSGPVENLTLQLASRSS